MKPKNYRKKQQSYAKYLLSEKWQVRKSKYYESHSRKCFVCGTEFGIELHHCIYKRVGREKDCDLIPLCRVHHRKVHDYARQGKKFVRRLWRAHKEVKRMYKKSRI